MGIDKCLRGVCSFNLNFFGGNLRLKKSVPAYTKMGMEGGGGKDEV